MGRRSGIPGSNVISKIGASSWNNSNKVLYDFLY